MITQEQQKQGVELMRTLVEKAWESSTFKDQLVKNPKETISQVTGRDVNSLSKEKKIIVEDQSDKSIIYINIPPTYEDVELTAEELEIVSGGESGNADCNGWNPVKWIGYYAHQLYDYVTS